jgi:hypothetical protein
VLANPKEKKMNINTMIVMVVTQFVTVLLLSLHKRLLERRALPPPQASDLLLV